MPDNRCTAVRPVSYTHLDVYKRQKEYFESRNIHYICFHYMLGDTSYPDDLGQSIPFDEFYALMAAGEMTKTSQVNVDELDVYKRQGLQNLYSPVRFRVVPPKKYCFRCA